MRRTLSPSKTALLKSMTNELRLCLELLRLEGLTPTQQVAVRQLERMQYRLYQEFSKTPRRSAL